MQWADLVGYLASALVVVAFYMDNMIRLRIIAAMSNIAFLAYGTSLELGPVIALHGLLLPLNMWRLRQLCTAGASCDGRSTGKRLARPKHHPRLSLCDVDPLRREVIARENAAVAGK